MNNEQQELLDDVYKNYMRWAEEHSKTHLYEPYSQEEFINKIKTDVEFSERWGLIIEERELSTSERGDLFRKTYPYNSIDDFAPGGMEVQSISHQLNTRYDRAKIPTKLITITYNDTKLESYE